MEKAIWEMHTIRVLKTLLESQFWAYTKRLLSGCWKLPDDAETVGIMQVRGDDDCRTGGMEVNHRSQNPFQHKFTHCFVEKGG